MKDSTDHYIGGGQNSIAIGSSAHAEGSHTICVGAYSHAEGIPWTAEMRKAEELRKKAEERDKTINKLLEE